MESTPNYSKNVSEESSTLKIQKYSFILLISKFNILFSCSFTTTYKIFFNFFTLATKMFQFTKFTVLVFFKKIISYDISTILFNI